MSEHYNSLKTECVHGHKFTAANTYITRAGTRQCMACDRRMKRERTRNRADALANKWMEIP